NSAAGCGRSDWIAVVHPLRALAPLNLHLPGSDFLGHRRGQFQNSVLVSRFEVFGLQTLWQLDRSLERSVARLAPIVMGVLGLLVFIARTLDCKEPSGHPDVYVFRIDARNIYPDSELVAINERFECRTK